MSNATIEFVEGDTGSALVVTCKKMSDRTIISLVGDIVQLRYSISGGVTQTKSMSLVDPVNGIAQYQFLAGELTPGTMVGEVKITDGSGNVVTSLAPFRLEVRAKL